MHLTQEPKYDLVIQDGTLLWRNRLSRKCIPHNEPVLVLRASDFAAVYVLTKYLGELQTNRLFDQPEQLHSSHVRAVKGRLQAFLAFRNEHPERMQIDCFADCHPTMVSGKVVLESQGEPVPEDEPVFVLRARDGHAVAMLSYYAWLAPSEAMAVIAERQLASFQQFAAKQPAFMQNHDALLTLQFLEGPGY